MAVLRCSCGNIFSRPWKLTYSSLTQDNIALKWINSSYYPKWQINFCTAANVEKEKRPSPRRKKRDRFTVLKALASTVNSVQTKPDYRFFDDPILLPRTLRKQKEALLAIGSGEEAANQIIEKYSDLFPFRVPEPKWPDRTPTKSNYVSNDEVSVENLRKVIKSGENIPIVVDWYNILCSQEDISVDIHNDMLDFASFHAIHGGKIDDTVELHEQSALWAENNFAETLFSELRNAGKVNGRTYEVFILGLLKYGEISRAFEVYREMVEKKFHGSLFMYNTLLEYVFQAANSDDERWDLAQFIVSGMRENNVKPNVVTFNEIMAIAAEKSQGAGTLCVHLLREMKNLGISPSLGTYHYILLGDKKEDLMAANLVKAILRDLRRGVVDFVLQHPADLQFFHTAMDVARRKQKKEIAMQILDLVRTHKIEHLISQVSSFYGNYLLTIARHSDVDSTFAEYRKLVPAHFIPRDWMIEQIFFAFQHQKDPRYVPDIFYDMMSLRVPVTPRGMNSMFAAMGTNIPKDRAEEFFDVVIEAEKWMEIYNIAKTRETQSVAIKVFCLCNKYDAVMSRLVECKHLKIVPSADAMYSILELAINHGNNEDAVSVLEAMAKYNMKLTVRVLQLIDSTDSLSSHAEKIKSWF